MYQWDDMSPPWTVPVLRPMTLLDITQDMKGCGPIPQELSEAQEHKAVHLYRWARDASKQVSRDEVADMVRVPLKSTPDWTG